MTQEELDHLRESCIFSVGGQTRLPEVSETIMSASLGEVTFNEVAFLAGLCFPIHPTLKENFELL